MKKGSDAQKRYRAYGVTALLIIGVLGTALAAWSWERSGNNFFLTGGRVFIGVSSPTSSHSGDANAYLQVHNPESNPNNVEVARFTAKVGSNRSSYITVGDPTLDPKGTQGYLAYSPSAKKWQIGTHFNGPTMTLSSLGDGGYVGIGTTSPAHPLHLSSGAYVSSGGVWTNASSREFKENINDLSAREALSAFHELKPMLFNYRNDQAERHVGFIAEDVPDLLASKDRKGLSSMDIVAVLTRVVQEQERLIGEQRETLGALAKRIEVLEKRQ